MDGSSNVVISPAVYANMLFDPKIKVVNHILTNPMVITKHYGDISVTSTQSFEILTCPTGTFARALSPAMPQVLTALRTTTQPGVANMQVHLDVPYFQEGYQFEDQMLLSITPVAPDFGSPEVPKLLVRRLCVTDEIDSVEIPGPHTLIPMRVIEPVGWVDGVPAHNVWRHTTPHHYHWATRIRTLPSVSRVIDGHTVTMTNITVAEFGGQTEPDFFARLVASNAFAIRAHYKSSRWAMTLFSTPMSRDQEIAHVATGPEDCLQCARTLAMIRCTDLASTTFPTPTADGSALALLATQVSAGFYDARARHWRHAIRWTGGNGSHTCDLFLTDPVPPMPAYLVAGAALPDYESEGEDDAEEEDYAESAGAAEAELANAEGEAADAYEEDAYAPFANNAELEDQIMTGLFHGQGGEDDASATSNPEADMDVE